MLIKMYAETLRMSLASMVKEAVWLVEIEILYDKTILFDPVLQKNLEQKEKLQAARDMWHIYQGMFSFEAEAHVQRETGCYVTQCQVDC